MKTILFFKIIFLAFVAQGRAIDCSEQREVVNKEFFTLPSPPENLEFPHQQAHTVCLKPTDASTLGNAKITLEFGEIDTSSNFREGYEMQLRSRGKYLQYYFQQVKGDKEKYVDGRIPLEWLSSANWTCFSLTIDKITFHFGKDDQALDIKLSGLKVESVKEVRITADSKIIASADCERPEEIQERTTTTKATTTLSAIPIVNPDYTSQTLDLQNSSEPSISDTGDGITDITQVLGNSDTFTSDPSLAVVPVAVREESVYDDDCARIPFWAWVCVGIMAIFIFLFFVLLIYTIILTRRNKALMASSPKHGDYIRGGFSPPGGLGQQVRDLQYFKTENQSVVAIAPHPTSSHNIQTLRLPSSNVITPDVRFYTAPRVSEYRRSISCPTGHQDPSPSINFPAPPSTPPPVARPETVPVFCPNGSSDDVDHSYKRGRNSTKRSSSRRQRQRIEGIDADDESSLSN